MKIIRITGSKHSGKSTIAKMLCGAGWHELSFARPLKEGLQKIFGLTDEQVHGSQKEETDPYWNVTPRELLQVIGTDLLRNRLPVLLPSMRQHRCPSLWIRCLDKQLQHILRCQEGFPYKGIVISDVRFPDEIDFIRECNGAIWHVINCRAPLDPRHHHASERLAQDLDAIKADVIIYNNSTLDDLRHKIMKHEEAI